MPAASRARSAQTPSTKTAKSVKSAKPAKSAVCPPPRKQTPTTVLSPLDPAAPLLSFFVAGIIQGSLAGDRIHAQDYRTEVAGLLRERYPGARIYDPFAHHPQSVGYDYDLGRDVFFDLMDRAGHADVVVAFLPEASMGTAIELWNAFHAGAVVVVVSALCDNWVVKFLADRVVADLAAFRRLVADGGLDRLIEKKIIYRARNRG